MVTLDQLDMMDQLALLVMMAAGVSMDTLDLLAMMDQLALLATMVAREKVAMLAVLVTLVVKVYPALSIDM
jgi:hypothetical protein